VNANASYRGQPLIALTFILGGWIAARMMAWDAAAVDNAKTAPPPITQVASQRPAVRPAPRASPLAPSLVLPLAPQSPWLKPEPAIAPRSLPPRLPTMPAPVPYAAPSPAASAPVPATVSAAHQLLWMAALARLPLPAAVLAPVALPAAPARPSYRAARWSADGWLLLRRGGEAAPAGGFAPASYGASQMAAVVRFRLAPESAHRPAAYLRASAALNGSREREAALGLSARPIAAVPVVAAVEARVNDQPSATSVRPAALVYTEAPPFALPLGARGEFYGQAGYVGGNFATFFADGQVRVDRRVLRLGRGELRAGGGAWGGAQKGAARLDIGPSATLGVALGGSGAARVALDWRFRVAGNAAPASGPALTLSAGF
jgi:hypothetical protein